MRCLPYIQLSWQNVSLFCDSSFRHLRIAPGFPFFDGVGIAVDQAGLGVEGDVDFAEIQEMAEHSDYCRSPRREPGRCGRSGCPVGFFRCRSSDFVGYEPGSHPTVQKKEVFRLPSWGAQWDSNPRHSEPQSDALTN